MASKPQHGDTPLPANYKPPITWQSPRKACHSPGCTLSTTCMVDAWGLSLEFSVPLLRQSQPLVLSSRTKNSLTLSGRPTVPMCLPGPRPADNFLLQAVARDRPSSRAPRGRRSWNSQASPQGQIPAQSQLNKEGNASAPSAVLLAQGLQSSWVRAQETRTVHLLLSVSARSHLWP